MVLFSTFRERFLSNRGDEVFGLDAVDAPEFEATCERKEIVEYNRKGRTLETDQ